MKTVCKENTCTGCMACVNVCPKDAISIKDSLNSYTGVIDNNLCINCNACYKVCQNNNDIKFSSPISWYQGWSKDEKIRSFSSSGGVATELIKTFLREYGSVCSCILKNGEFIFEFADVIDNYHKFHGSKYVKSNPKKIYREIKAKLVKGTKVLFIGLPCQVQALKLFVGTSLLDDLYTVDLICHGTPSPEFLKEFLNEYGFNLENENHIAFRKNNKFHLYNNQQGIEPERIVDTYTYAFLNSLIYTENCYSCEFAKTDRVSDITIGDSWGSKLSLDEQKKGISLILCQSEKGKKLIEMSNLNLFDVDIDIAIKNNKQLMHPSNLPSERVKFYKIYQKNNKFKKAVEKCYPKVFYKEKIKKFLIDAHIINSK